MGMCLPCLGSSSADYNQQPDAETRRRQQAEAAEKRLKEQESRGVKDSQRIKDQQRKKEQLERKAELSGDGGGLRWQVG